MPVPDYQTLMLPVLRCAAGGETGVSECLLRLKRDLAISDEEAAELLPSGRQTYLRSRTAWAISYLVHAGLLERPRRGRFQLTERGRGALAENPQRIDIAFLDQFPEFVAFRTRVGTKTEAGTAADAVVASLPSEAAGTTPEELIDAAEREIAARLRDDLLAKVLEGSPEDFERLILDLLLAMGYGGSRREAGLRVGGTGDGGVDGVINEDPLGLDVIYVQAKRYARDRAIPGEAVRAFAGALLTRGASKGVFVTTSRFTRDAVETAGNVQTQRIVLIDGERLAGLMSEHGVGVRTERTIAIKKVDLDYFEPEAD